MNVRVNLELLEDAPKKKDGRGRPRKERASEQFSQQMVTPVQLVAAPAQAAGRDPMSVIPQPSGLSLPKLSIQKKLNVQISGSSDASDCLEVENGMQAGTITLHRVRCIRGGKKTWETVFASRVAAAVGNSFLACVACDDFSLSVFSMAAGRRLCPTIALNGPAAALQCSGVYAMVITSRGVINVWNFQSMACTLKNESLSALLPNGPVKLEQCSLTEQGLPVVPLSNGFTFTYKTELGCWVRLTSSCDSLFLCSDHKNCVPENARMTGPLTALQSSKERACSSASRLFRAPPTIQPAATVSYLENQIQCCLALKSAREYHMWLLTYVRYLVNEAMESKLREVCDELIGPQHRSKAAVTKWDSAILGYHKHDLLTEILQIVGMNVRFQRLFAEYQEQLSASTNKLS